MSFRLLIKRWLQIVISISVLAVIAIFSAPLFGLEIFSQKSLQILLSVPLLSVVIIGYIRFKKSRLFSQLWLTIFIVGIALAALTIQVLHHTGNIYYLPAAVVLSAGLVPVTAIAFLYQHIRTMNLSIRVMMDCFFIGGALGYIAAGFIAAGTEQNWSVPALFGTGFVEESAKLVFPVVLFIMWKYRHESDGLLIGVASGMGFSALETMGDALYTFMTSGSVEFMQVTLFYRGLLAPAAHAAWTGFLCAVLWGYRERTGRWIGAPTVGAFILVVVLHALWNIIACNFSSTPIGSQTPLQLTLSAVEFLAVAGAGLSLFIWRYRKSRGTPVSDASLK